MNMKASAHSLRKRFAAYSMIVLFAIFIYGMSLATSKDEVIIMFRLSEDQVSLNAPVFADLSIHNDFSEEVYCDLGHNRKGALVFTVARSGSAPVELQTPIEEGIGRIGRISIAPNQTYTQRLLLNEWYDFSNVGTYSVRARLSTQIKTRSGEIVPTKVDDALELEIQPRNKKWLREICQSLAQTAIRPAAEPASEAALALSYIKDPIAVPYLDQVMEKGMLTKELAVRGLARIGNDEAVEVLIKALTKPDEKETDELRPLVAFALSKLQETTQDSSIKQRIKRVLGR
jgi:hypothetical protein